MARDFSDHNPKWRNEGRTGPNGPRYAKSKDRATVRNGGKVSKSKGSKQPTNGPYSWGNGPQPKGKCCFAGEAVKAVWAGKFRLARRFAVLDIKTRLRGGYA